MTFKPLLLATLIASAAQAAGGTNTVTWQPGVGCQNATITNCPVIGWKIQRQVNGGAWSPLTTIINVKQLSYVDVVTTDGVYSYRVIAADSFNPVIDSDPSTTVSFTFPIPVPIGAAAAPINVAVSGKSP